MLSHELLDNMADNFQVAFLRRFLAENRFFFYRKWNIIRFFFEILFLGPSWHQVIVQVSFVNGVAANRRRRPFISTNDDRNHWRMYFPKYFLDETLPFLFHDDVIKWKHFPRYWSLCEEFTGHRWIPLTKAIDAELWCFLCTRLSQQSRRRWFETLLRSFRRYCNANFITLLPRVQWMSWYYV